MENVLTVVAMLNVFLSFDLTGYLNIMYIMKTASFYIMVQMQWIFQVFELICFNNNYNNINIIRQYLIRIAII